MLETQLNNKFTKVKFLPFITFSKIKFKLNGSLILNDIRNNSNNTKDENFLKLIVKLLFEKSPKKLNIKF